MTALSVTSAVSTAKRPEDLFGAFMGTRAEWLEELERSYARLKDTESSPRLDELYEAARKAVQKGTYGRASFIVPRTISSGKVSYRVLLDLDPDAVSRLYLTETGEGEAIVRVAKSADHDDKLRNEANALARLNSADAVESRLRAYVPELLESFEATAKSGARQANATRHIGGLYSLEEVRAAYPAGVRWQDAAWIYRRLLVAVGYAHVNGVLHLAATPERILVQPEEHGLVLHDWAYAVPQGVEEVKVRPEGEDVWYPEEAFSGRPGPESDVYMATRAFQYVLGAEPGVWKLPANVPGKLKNFLSACVSSQRSRPDDAWALKQEFDDLLGPRQFRPFVMPVREGTEGAIASASSANPDGTETPSSGDANSAAPTQTDSTESDKGEQNG